MDAEHPSCFYYYGLVKTRMKVQTIKIHRYSNKRIVNSHSSKFEFNLWPNAAKPVYSFLYKLDKWLKYSEVWASKYYDKRTARFIPPPKCFSFVCIYQLNVKILLLHRLNQTSVCISIMSSFQRTVATASLLKRPNFRGF